MALAAGTVIRVLRCDRRQPQVAETLLSTGSHGNISFQHELQMRERGMSAMCGRSCRSQRADAESPTAALQTHHLPLRDPTTCAATLGHQIGVNRPAMAGQSDCVSANAGRRTGSSGRRGTGAGMRAGDPPAGRVCAVPFAQAFPGSGQGKGSERGRKRRPTI